MVSFTVPWIHRATLTSVDERGPRYGGGGGDRRRDDRGYGGGGGKLAHFFGCIVELTGFQATEDTEMTADMSLVEDIETIIHAIAATEMIVAMIVVTTDVEVRNFESMLQTAS